MKQTNGNGILIVDDEPIVRESLRDGLISSGYQVATAEDASQALDMIGNHDFNIAILDLSLPDVERTELLKRFGKRKPDLKSIIITAYPLANLLFNLIFNL